MAAARRRTSLNTGIMMEMVGLPGRSTAAPAALPSPWQRGGLSAGKPEVPRTHRPPLPSVTL